MTNYIVSLQDITERKKMEEQLLYNNALLEAQSETTIDGIIVVNEKDEIVMSNKRLQEMWNIPDEWIEAGDDKRLLEHVADQTVNPEAFKKKAQYLNENKEEKIRDEFKCKDGRIIDRYSAPMIDTNGTYQGRIWYNRDITEARKMEARLMATDRLASIGELTSGIAHEINNPLTAVIGYSDLLLSKELPDYVKEDLEIIGREAKRTAKVVRNLLTFARGRTGEKQLVDINKVIRNVLDMRAYEQGANNIEVDTQFAADLPEILADNFQLQQAFLNIVINAEHFMYEAYEKGTLTITTKQAGDIIRASFADNGPGISPENLSHLFDPFFTTKEVGKGTGLGLSICHGTVTEHGGRIYAESELGKGATFIVELPTPTADNSVKKKGK